MPRASPRRLKFNRARTTRLASRSVSALIPRRVTAPSHYCTPGTRHAANAELNQGAHNATCRPFGRAQSRRLNGKMLPVYPLGKKGRRWGTPGQGTVPRSAIPAHPPFSPLEYPSPPIIGLAKKKLGTPLDTLWLGSHSFQHPQLHNAHTQRFGILNVHHEANSKNKTRMSLFEVYYNIVNIK